MPDTITFDERQTITVDQDEAERLTNLSAKTLERYALAGEQVGRMKIGRRVLFVRKTLESWITSKLTTPLAGDVAR